MFITGSLEFGPVDHQVQGLKKHGLDYQILTGKDCSSQYKGMSLPEEETVLFQPDGGFLLSEDCIRSHYDAATVGNDGGWAIKPLADIFNV